MAGLVRTAHVATVNWLGRVPDRDSSLRSVSVSEVWAGLAGFDGEAHGGLTRSSCSRVRALYPRGTEIRNTRQLSMVSAEELATIAAAIGVDAVDPAWIGASVVVSGIADFSHVPPGSRLQSQDGTTLTVDVENGPCHLPAPVIEADAPGAGRLFKTAAAGRRGLTAWVEREGPLRVGGRLVLFVPDQPAWQP